MLRFLPSIFHWRHADKRRAKSEVRYVVAVKADNDEVAKRRAKVRAELEVFVASGKARRV